jgi:quercetin dioxygenase-like cupin family protein
MKQILLVLAAMALGAATPAQEAPVLVSPDDVKWTDGPPSLPAGAKAVGLAGDPKNPGPFTVRLKMPAGYKIPPHWHPDTETVTVLSGTFYVSMGDTLDTSKGKGMPAGSFIAVPSKSPHFAYTKEETVIQVNAVGPWSLNYVNPADDPRKANK